MYDKKELTEEQLEAWRVGKLRFHCQETVFGDRCWDHQCGNFATVERDGTVYCKAHDPVRKAEKRAARDKKWDDERAQKDEHQKQCKADFTRRVIAATTTESASELVDEIVSAGFSWWR